MRESDDEHLEASLREIREQLRSALVLVDERDRLYAMRFNASEHAIQIALSAQKDQTITATQAADRAMTKVELSQRDHEVRVIELKHHLEARLDALKFGIDTGMQGIQSMIALLQSANAENVGMSDERRRAQTQRNWQVGAVITVAIGIMSFVIALYLNMRK